MHPELRAYYDHVYPLFWPWLWWNLIRAALWHQRTGRDALMAVDCFGNIRIVFLGDAPKPDDLYSYDQPKTMPWNRLAPGFALQQDVYACARPESRGAHMWSINGVYMALYMTPAFIRGPPHAPYSPQIPAQAGIHGRVLPIAHADMIGLWMPAFAGICGN